MALPAAIANMIDILLEWNDHTEVLEAIRNAIFQRKDFDFSTTEQLGQGFCAEEALSIAIYSSLLSMDNFKNAIITSVNHGGDSDSTGAITGNIMGTLLGDAMIPKNWVDDLDLKNLVIQMAQKLKLKIYQK